MMTGSSGGGGGGNRLTYAANTEIGVEFPGRQKRLESLLNQARVKDYRVGPEWFAVMETYEEDGWNTLRKEGLEEAGLREVLRDWARWKYGLEKVRTTEEAWGAFEKICDEADGGREYLPTSVAGEAVALLVPKLRVESLIRRAEGVLRSLGSVDWGYMKWRFGGEVYYGVSEREGGVNVGGEGSFSFTGSGNRRIPASTFAVAQALRAKWEAGEGREAMRDRLAP